MFFLEEKISGFTVTAARNNINRLQWFAKQKNSNSESTRIQPIMTSEHTENR